jgi:hypothetical protein
MGRHALSTSTAHRERLLLRVELLRPGRDLPELSIEVDSWTGFTDHLTPGRLGR